MNELQTQKVQLPDTIEDLTQFVLVGKAKLQAYMLKLQTVNKLSVAQEIRDQTLQEAQEVSSALIAAEQRIGELLLAIPKAQGKRTDVTSDERSTKVDVIKEMGYGTTEAKDYQQMAKHPEVVRKVLDDALADGTVVTKSQVMKEIREANRKATEENERLKRILSEKEAENVRLKSQKPEIREIEVKPSDYDLIQRERKQYLDERNRANARIKELEEREGIHDAQMKLERESEYLETQINTFIRTTGGYVWITEKITELPEDKRMNVIKAIKNINAWSQQMLTNIGGNLNG